jgi:hypothetical protein
MKNNPLADDKLLIVSNYIIASVRKIISAKYEVYEKWYLLKAFNGAVLIDSNDKCVTCYFFKPEHVAKENSSGIKCSFDDMVILVLGDELKEDEIRRTIEQAHEDASRLSQSNSVSVGLLHASIIYHSPESNKFEKSHQIASEIGNYLDAVFYATEPKSFDENYDFDVDFILKIPVTPDELSLKLKTLFPTISNHFFGVGVISINHDGQNCKNKDLKWAHFYGRHHFELKENINNMIIGKDYEVTLPIRQNTFTCAIAADGGTVSVTFEDNAGINHNLYIDRRVHAKTKDHVYSTAYPESSSSIYLGECSDFVKIIDSYLEKSRLNSK